MPERRGRRPGRRRGGSRCPLGARAPGDQRRRVILHTNLGRAPLPGAAVAALAASAGRYTSVEIDLHDRPPRGAGGLCRGSARRAQPRGGRARRQQQRGRRAPRPLGARRRTSGRRVAWRAHRDRRWLPGPRRAGALGRSARRGRHHQQDPPRRLPGARSTRRPPRQPRSCASIRATSARPGSWNVPALAELAELARARGALLLKDLGGGALVDLAPMGLAGEPTVRSTIAAGAEPRLLQHGQGARRSTGRCARRPRRARREGAAGPAGPRPPPRSAPARRPGSHARRLPGGRPRRDPHPRGAPDAARVGACARRALVRGPGRARRAGLGRGFDIEVGGGALADASLASAGVALDARDAEALSARLRAGEPPVVGRIQEGRLLLDARSVLPAEDEPLLEAVVRAWSE